MRSYHLSKKTQLQKSKSQHADTIQLQQLILEPQEFSTMDMHTN